MKILYLSDNFPPESSGGADIVAFELAREMKRQGHDVYVITTTQTKGPTTFTKHEGIKVYRVYANFHSRWSAYLGIYNPQTIGEIRRILHEIGPNTVHAHNIHRYLSYQALKISKLSGAKVFLTAHDAMSFHYGKLDKVRKVSSWAQLKKYKKRYNPLRNAIIRKYFGRYVDKIFAVSVELKEALEVNGVHGVMVIHNGIDTSRWQISKDRVAEFKSKFALNGKKIVLFGGRLSEPKGGEKIIRVMKRVVKEVPETVLLVLGKSNDYSKKMITLAERLNINSRVVFTEWISGEELIASYHASNIVVTPSLYLDPFPTVNLEAMACARPVVGTYLGGTKEVVLNEKTGFIIDPFDTEAVALKITELLNNPKKAEEFGKAGMNRVKTCFTLTHQVEKTLRYYLE